MVRERSSLKDNVVTRIEKDMHRLFGNLESGELMCGSVRRDRHGEH